MRRTLLALFALVACLTSASATSSQESASDLYHVTIGSHDDAARLASLPVDPLLRVSDGYLVLVTDGGEHHLVESGLRSHLVASDVNRRMLALDNRMDNAAVGQYPIIYEEKGVRLYRIDPADPVAAEDRALCPIRTAGIPVVYGTAARMDKSFTVSSEQLDSLINTVREDSLVSLSEHLQSYDGRWVGSTGDFLSAYWAKGEFEDYGYDSVVIDTFTEVIGGGPQLCRNVLAYKVGTDLPYYHTIICAHRDTEPGSPGADDNGSGTAAVLEIARALKDIDTRMTFVFILFDAEEEGLLGAWHYARRAATSNQRIAYALNMDMIAHYENNQDIYVYQYEDGDPICQLWADLADSIPSINLISHIDYGAGGSDHYPFWQFGYDAIFIHEYIFSTVYHSYRDSTTYMNFDYMTRAVKASLATAYVVDQQFVPDYEIYVNALDELPLLIYPQEPSPVEIVIREYGGAQLVPGSALLHYSVNDGDMSVAPMIAIGNDVYSGHLPALNCLDNVVYYITLEDDSLGIIHYPGQGDSVLAVVATGTYAVFEDYFETDLGWTVESDAQFGEWERVEVTLDYDGNGLYYYAGKNIVGVRDGYTSLTSPPIEINGFDCIIEYARWCVYRNDIGPQPDSMHVLISASGFGWSLVEAFEPVPDEDRAWRLKSFRISDYFIEPPQTVWLRFIATENGADSHLRAGVDAVRVISYATDSRIVTEGLANWTAGQPYSEHLKAATCDTGTVTWSDYYNQLPGTGLTLSTEGLLSGIPVHVGPVVFTAQITDQFGGHDEQWLSFIIYDSLKITTASIPAATINEAYTCQLNRTGGTGTKTWTDRDGDLAGSGISLSPGGLLSGTPTEAVDIPFVARVTDEAGAATEKTFTMHIIGPYICGDASGDGGISVGDAVWIINYVFSGGPAPNPIESGDANADGDVTVADAVYIINYIFKGGPEPQCP